MDDNDVTAEILAAFEELLTDERRELDEMGKLISEAAFNFSLAWRPGQDPDKALDEFLEANGLKLTERGSDDQPAD